MCATFSNGDVGKSVVNGNGEEVGVVTSVEGDVAHVRPETAAVDSVKSSIGWEGVADAAHPLDTDSVREITDDAVHLEGELPSVGQQDLEAAVDSNTGDDAGEERTEPAGGSAGTEETEIAEDLRDETGEDTLEETDAIDERGTTAPDETESGRDRASDRGLEADPTELARQEREGGTRAGASVEPTDDFELTDAAVDRTGEPRRTDAAVDPGEQPRGADVDPAPDSDRDAEAERGGPTTEDAGKTDLEDDPEPERLRDRTEGEDDDDRRGD
ncbi:hypothetical protein JMJ58_12725 [Haloterrigena salifodinae]|uniref:PRC-barrel domain-containing protein n=1 Tax=Haloterrigena salifodinae TaxID=2675099 RepID=A0A8T8DXG1_9EURY|nr:hypothetical protein [Haloterrigena salifodinae]QRV13816.1 hypothetical protein JMJ58_12725 [Haloterrigena salifodinae]